MAERCSTHKSSTVCRAATGSQSAPALVTAVEAEVVKEDIVVTEQKLPGGVLELTITVPEKHTTKAWNAAIKYFAKNLVLEGFRKGKKVPDEIILQKAGKSEVLKEAVDQLLRATVPKAVEDYSQSTYVDSFEIEDGEALCARFVPKRPFTFACRLTMCPEVKWKSNYKDIKVEMDASVDDKAILESVQRKIWASLKTRGSLRVASQRGVEMGDVAVINFVARRGKNREEIAGSRQVKMHLDTAEPSPIIGMEEMGEDVIGMTVGETKSFKHIMPNTWWEPDVRGTEVIYEITVQEVLAWELPEMTDEVAKQLIPDCSGVKDLTKRLDDAERLEHSFLMMDSLKQEICRQLATVVDANVPEFYFHDVAANEYQRQLLTSAAEGTLTREEVDQLATEDLLEKFKDSQREPLMETALITIAIAQIFKEQKLTVPEEMLQEALENAKTEGAAAEEEFDEERLRVQIEEELQGQVTLDWLLATVDIQMKGNPELQQTLADYKNKNYFMDAAVVEEGQKKD